MKSSYWSVSLLPVEECCGILYEVVLLVNVPITCLDECRGVLYEVLLYVNVPIACLDECRRISYASLSMKSSYWSMPLLYRYLSG